MRIVELLQDVVSVLLLPLYFAVSGLKTDVTLLDNGTSWALVLITIVAACVGEQKYVCSPFDFVHLACGYIASTTVNGRCGNDKRWVYLFIKQRVQRLPRIFHPNSDRTTDDPPSPGRERPPFVANRER